jgi:hypothetical protein
MFTHIISYIKTQTQYKYGTIIMDNTMGIKPAISYPIGEYSDNYTKSVRQAGEVSALSIKLESNDLFFYCRS